MSALSDIRVVELGQLIAGPFCGQLLGDMGAEVVKIEPPGVGDPMRQWGRGAKKLWWQVIGRNKQSVTADLRHPEGQRIAREFAARADILIENFRPGTLEKWGLAPADLLALNPRLIVVRISGFGQTGPYARRPGFGGIAEAMGGWRHIVGDPDRPPARMGVSIGDTLAASYACMGALAALHARERTGRGQVIDMALYEAVLQVMESLIPEYDVSGEIRGRSGAILPGIAPSNVYPCADGELMIGANKDELFVRLAAAMGEPELADDPRYATHVARGEHQQELDDRIAAWTRRQTVAAVERKMLDASVPAGRVYTAPDILADPHVASRDAIVSVPSDDGEIRMQACFPKFSATPGSVRSPAPPSPGIDTHRALAALGYSDDAIADLRRRKIV